MTTLFTAFMRKGDRHRFILVVVLLVAAPRVAHGEPIEFTSGFFAIDHTDTGPPADFVASGPGTALNLFGAWTAHRGPSRVDGFIDPSFSGVLEFDGFDDEEGFPELQLGERLLNLRGTLNVSVTGPRLPIPSPSDEFDSTFVNFSGVLQASLQGITHEGEVVAIDLTRRGGGFLFFGLPASAEPLSMRDTSFGFGPSAPIPEPGTMLLVSAGALAALARQRRYIWQRRGR